MQSVFRDWLMGQPSLFWTRACKCTRKKREERNMAFDISRRSFVAASGALAGLAAAGTGATFGMAEETAYEEGVTTTWGHCAINCPGRCSLKFHVKDGEVLYVETYATDTLDLDDPQPRACLKGRSYRAWMNDPNRINFPMKRVEGTKRGDGVYEQITWEEALDTIAEKLRYVIDTYGNEAVYNNYATGVSCTTSRPLGRLLNLLGGYLSYYGSYSAAQYAWIAPYLYGGASASTISVAADADLVLAFGTSPVETRQGGAVSHHDWVRARENNQGKMYIIDPRLSDSLAGHSADWLPINPGTDAALISAIAHELIVNDQVDIEFLHTYCVGFDEETMPESAKGQNKSYTDYIMGTGYDMVEKTPEWAAPITGIAADRIRELTAEIAAAERMFVVQGWGNQRRSNGEMSTVAVCMLPILTGNFGLPGTSSGMREGTGGAFGLKSMSGLSNPVTTKISVFSMIDAIDHGTEMTEVADGVVGKEKLDTNIKFVFNYAGNCITNQNSQINRVHDVMADDTKCEFVVGIDVSMCDSMKYCDIILPDMFRFEQDSMIAAAGDDAYMICGTPVLPEAKFERRTCYDWAAELAEKMGVGEEFTEGKTQLEWIESLYEASREADPSLPTLEEFRAQGVVTKQGKKVVAYEAFRNDPVANPLPTPSGKIEIYSERLDQYIQTHEFAEDDFVAPVPVYATEWYGVETTTEELPLVLNGFHYRSRIHSSWGGVELLKDANPQEAWINPADAEARGIAQGDVIHVTNDFGTVELLAKVTPRVIPGVVAISQGAWHDADMAGDRIDKGGCINTLTTLRPSPLAKGNPQHTNICQVVKA